MSELRKVPYVCLYLILLFILGCAQTGPAEGPHSLPHPHINPLTQVVDNYHVRLVVQQPKGKMFLVFEDISEEPIRAVRQKPIHGRVYLPEGEELKVIFRPVPPWFQKYHRPRRHHEKRPVSLFVYKGNWIKATRGFDLVVDFEYRRTIYPLDFKYTSPQK